MICSGWQRSRVVKEEAIRIVKVREHQVEVADVIHPPWIEHSARSKERAERAVIHGADRVEVVALQGNLRDARMAEHFDVRIGPALTQQTQGGKRDDEVTQGAAADEQNPHHKN